MSESLIGTKLKDLPGDTSLNILKVKTSEGVVGYWKSQWVRGVFLSDGESDRVYPQFLDDLADALEWEVTDEEVNCNEEKI